MLKNKKDSLQLFIDKVEEVEKESFWQYSLSVGHQLSLVVAVGPEKAVENKLPTIESLKAFILSFRIFFQDNDALQVGKINTFFQEAYRRKNSNPNTEFTKYYDQYRNILKHPYLSDTIPTIEELIRVFLYGHYAHINPKYESEYQKIRDTEDYELYHYFFICNLTSLLQYALIPMKDEIKKHIHSL